jgi:hypothetical protein
MAKRKATVEELEARAESNSYKRGSYREEDSTQDNGKHNKKIKRNQKFGVRPLRVVRDQCLSTRANFDTNMLHTRWTLSEMRKDAFRRDLPAGDEACARHQCFHYDPHKHLQCRCKARLYGVNVEHTWRMLL